MGNPKRPIEVAGKGHCERDEGWVNAIEMLLQGLEHELVCQGRRGSYRVGDGVKRGSCSSDVFGIATQRKMGGYGRLNQISQVFKIECCEAFRTVLIGQCTYRCGSPF